MQRSVIHKINELSKDLFLVKTHQEFGKVFNEGFNQLIPQISKSLFYNFDWQSKEFELFSSFGFREIDFLYHGQKVNKVLKEVFESGTSIINSQIDENSILKSLNPLSKDGSDVCMPIIPFNDSSGVLYLYADKTEFFTSEIVSLCELIAGMGARAIKRLNLQKHQIKQSKVAEKRYISQKNLMSEILNYLPVNIYMKDENGRYIFINKQGEETINLYDGEALGKTDYELFPRVQADRSRMIDNQIRSDKKAKTLQEDMFFDGSIHHMYTSKKLIKTADSKELILGFSIDITDNINIQKDLEEQKKFIQQVLDSSPNLIYVKDGNGNYLLVNQSFADIFNTTKEKVINSLPGKSGVHFDDDELTLSMDKEVVSFQKTIEFEETLTLKNEEPKIFITTKIPIPGKDDKINVLCISVDVTAIKNNEKELIKAQRAKEQFLANMSHEIRTPINGIVGMISLLQSTTLNGEQQKYIDSIQSSSQHLKGIISEILDFSLIESGKINIESANFRPEQLFNELAYTFTKIITEKGLKFDYSFDKRIPGILKGDPVRLNQIVSNLLNNALKFTANGYIEMKFLFDGVKNGEQILKIKVSDSGIGISKEKQETIFESFKQADESISRKYGGTGLGLAICKQLAEIQGGSVSLKSALKKGAEFTVIIPYQLGTEEDVLGIDGSSNNAVHLEQHDFQGLKVLMAEDNEINTFYAKTVLKKFNCDVDVAENGKIALQKLSENNYQIVLMDLQMPEMDGYQATNKIRNEFPHPKNSIPIIAITANALKGEREKCLDAGMNDYISKPFEPSLLKNILSKYLNIEASTTESGDNVESSLPISNKLVDLSYLKKISDGDKSFIKEMIETFIKNAPEDIMKLKALMKRSNWDEIAQLAHKIKPALKFMGIKAASEHILEIEENTKMKTNLEKVPGLILQLEKEITEGKKELEQILAKDFEGILEAK